MGIASPSEIEFRVYGFYSSVAKELKTTINSVDTVYTWYLGKSLEQIEDGPSVQVFFKNLGMLKMNLTEGTKGLGRCVFGLEESLARYFNEIESKYEKPSAGYLAYRCNQLLAAMKSFKQRIERLRTEGDINEAVYANRLARLEHIDKKLTELYESIQRIPELEQKRVAECGQDFAWDDEQGSEPF
jgi:hypothetical protein